MTPADQELEAMAEYLGLTPADVEHTKHIAEMIQQIPAPKSAPVVADGWQDILRKVKRQ